MPGNTPWIPKRQLQTKGRKILLWEEVPGSQLWWSQHWWVRCGWNYERQYVWNLGSIYTSEISRARIPALSLKHPCCLMANTLLGIVLSFLPDNAWAQLEDSTCQRLFSGGSECSLFWGVKTVQSYKHSSAGQLAHRERRGTNIGCKLKWSLQSCVFSGTRV